MCQCYFEVSGSIKGSWTTKCGDAFGVKYRKITRSRVNMYKILIGILALDPQLVGQIIAREAKKYDVTVYPDKVPKSALSLLPK